MSGLFDGLVAINKLPENDEPFAAYILTRPFDLTSVQIEHAHKIFTTINLKWGMIYDKKGKIKEKVTAFMDSGVSYGIDLPNDKTLTICSYALNTFTLKVLILIEYENMYSLYYDGHVTDPEILIKKPKPWHLIKSNKIENLLLDTTSVNINKFKITENACEKIIKITKQLEYYQINLILDEFGYEDLLVELVNRGVKVFLDWKREKLFERNGPIKPTFFQLQIEADIFITDKMPTIDLIKRNFKDARIATMAFCTDLSYKKEQRSSANGLFYVEYTPHQTFPDALMLAEIIAPKNIIAIQPDAAIPSRLEELCQIKK